uniref:Alpha-2B adrenergic receptor n=1 Tax=Oryzias melastigma TaxID=30732 RepID=A0A3B3D443_ORYME
MFESGAVMAGSSNSSYSPQSAAAFATAITFMILMTIVGNVLVIIAVLTSRTLKAPQNLFLVSLAAADILVATIIIPFSLANELLGSWVFSSIWCEIHQTLDVLFCTSSIGHLCAIALDRYLSISRPVSYSTKRTAKRIKSAIVTVWLISAVISFPHFLTMSKKVGGDNKCELNEKPWYILYSTIGSFFAPCVIMILVYIRIYQIAKKHTRCPPAQPHKFTAGAAGEAEVKSPSEEPQREIGQGAPTAEQLPTMSQSTLRKAAENPAEAPPDQPQVEAEPAVPSSSSESVAEQQTIEEGDGDGPETLDPSPTCKYKDTIKTSSGTKLAPEASAKTQETPISRRKAMMNREKKFTFVLAVVMGVFVICWFPFFFSYSLRAVCPQSCSTPKPLFTFFFWIGYCNSCLNPVIYTVFNQDFRTAFKRILYRDTKGTIK